MVFFSLKCETVMNYCWNNITAFCVNYSFNCQLNGQSYWSSQFNHFIVSCLLELDVTAEVSHFEGHKDKLNPKGLSGLIFTHI